MNNETLDALAAAAYVVSLPVCFLLCVVLLHRHERISAWIKKLFGWFGKIISRRPIEQPRFVPLLPSEPEPPKIEILDDWKPEVGDWFEREACPCGCYARDWRTPYLTVCPKCGHRLELRVIRYEYETSLSRVSYNKDWWVRHLVPPYVTNHPYVTQRNVRIVFWTPEHCEKGAA